MKIINYIKNPLKDLKQTKALTLCSMLIALSVISSFLSFYLTTAIKFSFYFVFIAVIAMKFGPLIAAFCAAMTDIIQFIAKPVGPYQPLLTLSCALTGIIFGVFLYKNKKSLWRIIVSKLCISLLISSVLDSYFIAILYGKVFKEFLVTRTIKNIVTLPLEILLLYLVILAVDKIENRLK